MNITHCPLAYEERLTEAFALPAERQLTASLRVIPVTYSGTASREPADTLSLGVEVKAPGAEWEEVASTEPTSQEGVYKADVPMAPVVPFGEPGSLFRLRLKHTGRRDVRFQLQVEGF